MTRKKNKILPTGVELMTFWLPVQMFYHYKATGRILKAKAKWQTFCIEHCPNYLKIEIADFV